MLGAVIGGWTANQQLWMRPGVYSVGLRSQGLSCKKNVVITENSVHARLASLRGCDFPSAGYAGDSVSDRARTNRSRCRDLLRRKWPTGGAFAFRPKRVSAAMPALQTTKRRVAGIGGVIPRPEESLPRAPFWRFHCPGLRGVFVQGQMRT